MGPSLSLTRGNSVGGLSHEKREGQLHTNPTNHALGQLPCKVHRGPLSALMCGPFLFTEEAGLRECLSQDRRGRAQALPTSTPHRCCDTFLPSIPHAGDLGRWKLWEVGGHSGSSIPWRTKASTTRCWNAGFFYGPHDVCFVDCVRCFGGLHNDAWVTGPTHLGDLRRH